MRRIACVRGAERGIESLHRTRGKSHENGGEMRARALRFHSLYRSMRKSFFFDGVVEINYIFCCFFQASRSLFSKLK